LAITAPLAHAKRPPPGGYVQTGFPEKATITLVKAPLDSQRLAITNEYSPSFQ
jgi:hypothetical protein